LAVRELGEFMMRMAGVVMVTEDRDASRVKVGTELFDARCHWGKG
jgi:hypothetical protein